MFTVRGIPRNEPASPEREITWNAGVLLGDADMINLAYAESRRHRNVGPHEGPYTGNAADHIRLDTSALFILTELFIPESVRVMGDVPERPPIPAGAIG